MSTVAMGHTGYCSTLTRSSFTFPNIHLTAKSQSDLKLTPKDSELLGAEPSFSLQSYPTHVARSKSISTTQLPIPAQPSESHHPLGNPTPSAGPHDVCARAIAKLPKYTSQAVINSVSFRNILNGLLSPESEANLAGDGIQSFVATLEEFEALSYLINETACFGIKPKLTHDPEERIVIVELPHPTHEISVTDIREVMNSSVAQFPLKRSLVRTSLESSFTFRSSTTAFSATPDVSFLLMPMLSIPGLQKYHILGIVECAFSQGRPALEQKIRNELLARPEICFVIMIVVTEFAEYCGPTENSEAWTMFSQEDHCRDAEKFLELKHQLQDSCQETPAVTSLAGSESSNSDDDEEEAMINLNPVVVAGHTWCHIQRVEYFIWVRGDDDKRINIDVDKVACGQLFPTISMGDVESKLKEGLQRAKDSIVAFIKQLRPTAKVRRLDAFDVPLSVSWKTMQRALVPGADFTAHARYEGWYNFVFRRTKHPASVN